MAEQTESWTIQGITVERLECADRMMRATPEQAEQIAEILRADEDAVVTEAVQEIMGD